MSYQDPYNQNAYYAGGNNYHQSGSQSRYPAYPGATNHQAYDTNGNDFNPYAPNVEYRQEQPPAQESYQYNQGQYTDANPDQAQYEYNYPPAQPTKRHSKKSSVATVTVTPVRKEASGFEQGEFTPTVPTRRQPKTVRALRNYRLDHQGNLWTKGGRGRCVGRFCCCTLMTTVFLIASIVLALALWVRPPSVKIWPVQLINNVDGRPISTDAEGISINFAVNITVNNPNYFAVDFRKIEAEILYPLGGTSDDAQVGGGSLSNIVFESTALKNVTFPFSLSYKSSEDPQGKIILDLANKCGATGGPKGNISVNYKLTLSIRIILITISPVISNSFTFLCPLQPSDISKFLGGK